MSGIVFWIDIFICVMVVLMVWVMIVCECVILILLIMVEFLIFSVFEILDSELSVLCLFFWIWINVFMEYIGVVVMVYMSVSSKYFRKMVRKICLWLNMFFSNWISVKLILLWEIFFGWFWDCFDEGLFNVMYMFLNCYFDGYFVIVCVIDYVCCVSWFGLFFWYIMWGICLCLIVCMYDCIVEFWIEINVFVCLGYYVINVWFFECDFLY